MASYTTGAVVGGRRKIEVSCLARVLAVADVNFSRGMLRSLITKGEVGQAYRQPHRQSEARSYRLFIRLQFLALSLSQLCHVCAPFHNCKMTAALTSLKMWRPFVLVSFAAIRWENHVTNWPIAKSRFPIFVSVPSKFAFARFVLKMLNH